MKKYFRSLIFASVAGVSALSLSDAAACTGITLTAGDSSRIVARTIEWGGSSLNSTYVVVPRGYTQRSYTPEGVDGMVYTSRYGYVGMSVEQKEFVAEGLNEEGLSAGLFYFPGYGKYRDFDPAKKDVSIADLQLVSWILGECRTVDDVKKAVQSVRIVSVDPRASTVHWRFADPSGRQIVLEVIDGKNVFYENRLGVLTNSPGFDWQVTNLNNYVNLFPGTAPAQRMGAIGLSSFGAGSGFLGIPGDVTPPSRFVRAAFYQTTAPQRPTAVETVMQCFHILNNFDIPIGIETSRGDTAVDIPSATQWTAVTDMTNRVVYYRTMYNSVIRKIDLRSVDFARIGYRNEPLDPVKRQSVEQIDIE